METLDTSPDQRVVEASGGDDDPALRPSLLRDFEGQPKASAALRMAIAGATGRGETLDHVLLFGPPGLGKTTLAQIIANEMGGGFRSVAAPSIQRPGDLASALVSLCPGDVLFIDEIHRLPAICSEVLYGAMEDRRLDILAGDPSRPVPVRIPLPRFTLVGATTKSGSLPRPLRDRFGLDVHLVLYADEDLASVVTRSSCLLGMKLGVGVALGVAKRSRGTPRIANRMLRRLRDYAALHSAPEVTPELAIEAFNFLEVDQDGLDSRDREYLECLRTRFRGRPVGVKTIAAAIGEDPQTLEDEVEPWLVLKGLVDRTARGRVANLPISVKGTLI